MNKHTTIEADPAAVDDQSPTLRETLSELHDGICNHYDLLGLAEALFEDGSEILTDGRARAGLGTLIVQLARGSSKLMDQVNEAMDREEQTRLTAETSEAAP